MKKLILVALALSGSFLFAQNSSNDSKGQITITGCVSRSNGDYILMRTDPGVTYELQASGKTRLKHYLGQRVQVTGSESPTLSSSSDATAKEGSAAPVTLNITSIKSIDKDCSAPGVAR
jgi:hypothetical protein